MRILRRVFWAIRVAGSLMAAACVTLFASSGFAGELRVPYVDPAYYRNIRFGVHSYWAQPWRAYMETIPASVFVDGTGVVFNVDFLQADAVAAMLAKYGVHHARVEINWGSFDYDREDHLSNAAQIAVELTALKRHGVRPLILLNANDGAPCPMRNLKKIIAANAKHAQRTVIFTDVAGIIPGYTGLSKIGNDAAAAAILIVGLEGNVATLSKPLPVDLAAGTVVDVSTLKYRPFSDPRSPDFANTIRGWQAYVVHIAQIARADLGTTGKPDGGFDLEIWNELTFGSKYLSIDNYYSPSQKLNPDSKVWGPIVAATADAAVSHASLFSGVLIGDGFANTIPWRASATEPARIDAIDKHPYAVRKTYPADGQNGSSINAAWQIDTYIPAYTVNFPEYFATYMQTETMVRDMGPFNGDVYGTIHGRNARIVNGKTVPVTVWITEVNTAPDEDDPAISTAAALAIKAKAAARYFTFFLNKGVTQVDLYATKDTDRGYGTVLENYLTYAAGGNVRYPIEDKRYLSPALQVTGKIVSRMKDGLDRKLRYTRSLSISAVTAKIDPVIFKGDGTQLHPDLHAVDVFAFLPFQVNARRFVIPYYVMTRDIMNAWPEDSFTVIVAGFTTKARFSIYDPFQDTTTAVSGAQVANGVRLLLPTADYPRLLVVEERAAAANVRRRSPLRFRADK